MNLNITEMDKTQLNFILIDGSYFVFYRYFALNLWWKNAKSGEKPDISCNDEPEFIEKFKKTFQIRVDEMNDCLGIDKSIKLVGKDCKRSDIWRNRLYPSYKITRTKDDEFGVGRFFELTYQDKLFEAAGVDSILSYDHLEADDCIAITTKHLRLTYPEAHIWIIASDMDYLQLSDSHVHLRNLKYQDLCKSKNSTGDPEEDLFCKIVAGDKSDNIQSIFKKCGIKTARKYFQDQELFYKTIDETSKAEELYALNRTLVDFNYIPYDLVEGFRVDCLKLPARENLEMEMELENEKIDMREKSKREAKENEAKQNEAKKSETKKKEPKKKEPKEKEPKKKEPKEKEPKEKEPKEKEPKEKEPKEGSS